MLSGSGVRVMAWTRCSGDNRGLLRDSLKVEGSGVRLGVRGRFGSRVGSR